MRGTNLQKYALILLLIVVFLFGLYNFKSLFFGPTITVYSQKDYDRVSTIVRVEGHIEKPKEATINNTPLLVTPEGNFIATVYLMSPTDSIDIWAVNMYGKTAVRHIPLIVAVNN